MSNLISLDLIEVETPCSKDWNRMRGSDEKRFCDHCNRDVYDLGAMSEADVQNLLCQQAGKLCVRFTRLSSGKIQTLDYSTGGRKSPGWRFLTLVGAVGALIVGFVLGCTRFSPFQPRVTMGRMMVPVTPPTGTPAGSSTQPSPCQTP
jgi:hypothetical protein